MPKLRKKVRNDFTVINNAMIRDTSLGYTERGLLVTLLSLPENWDFSIKGLAAISPDGEHKIASTLKKIEAKGYLRRERVHSRDGRIADWIYTFSDEPIFLDLDDVKNTEPNTSSNSQSSPQKQNKALNQPVGENRNVATVSENLSPVGGFPDVVFPDVENRSDNKIYNNKINNNIYLSHQVNSSNREICTIEKNDRVIDENEYQSCINSVNEQLSVSHLYIENQNQKAQIDEIVEIIATVYSTQKDYLRIGGDNIDIALVRKRYKKLKARHIEYVLRCISKSSKSEIKNRKNYLMTCLFNSLSSVESGDVKTRERHSSFSIEDLAGLSMFND